jgi:predicted nuclease of predicted toxin-antitoxin system
VKVWLDAQLPPDICSWLTSEFGLEAEPVRELGLRDADDLVIFHAARDASVTIIISKDADFGELVRRHGPPPHVLWVTCGNTTNEALRLFLADTLPAGLKLIEAGEALVRLAEASGSD